MGHERNGPDVRQEHETPSPANDLSGEGQEALEVLQGAWSARQQTSENLDEICGTANAKQCKRLQDVGFDWLTSEAEGESPDVQSAWKRHLQRDGKLNPKGTSIRDLIADPESAKSYREKAAAAAGVQPSEADPEGTA